MSKADGRGDDKTCDCKGIKSNSSFEYLSIYVSPSRDNPTMGPIHFVKKLLKGKFTPFLNAFIIELTLNTVW